MFQIDTNMICYEPEILGSSFMLQVHLDGTKKRTRVPKTYGEGPHALTYGGWTHRHVSESSFLALSPNRV